MGKKTEPAVDLCFASLMSRAIGMVSVIAVDLCINVLRSYRESSNRGER